MSMCKCGHERRRHNNGLFECRECTCDKFEMAPKPEPEQGSPKIEPVTGIYMEMQYWPAKRGVRKPTLLVTYDALATILSREDSVIAPEDVSRLMAVFALYSDHEDSEPDAVTAWRDQAEAALAEEEEEP